MRKKRRHLAVQPLIAVKSVKQSAKWYCKLLNAENIGGRHSNVYDRILHNGQIILQLHSWDDENHPNLTNAKVAPIGHGVLLWFEIEDFESAVKRARKLRAEVLEEPHYNPAPRHHEMWIRDKDGYVVVLASPDDTPE